MTLPKARIRLRRPAALPVSADDGEPILIRSPRPRLYLGAGEGAAPQPLTVEQGDVEGLPEALQQLLDKVTPEQLAAALADRLAGKADLSGGKIRPEQLPPLPSVRTWTVYTSGEMLALDAQPGHYAIRMDLPEGYRHYVLADLPASAPLNWIPIETPESPHTIDQIEGLQAALAAGAGAHQLLGHWRHTTPGNLGYTAATGNYGAHPCGVLRGEVLLTPSAGQRISARGIVQRSSNARSGTDATAIVVTAQGSNVELAKGTAVDSAYSGYNAAPYAELSYTATDATPLRVSLWGRADVARDSWSGSPGATWLDVELWSK